MIGTFIFCTTAIFAVNFFTKCENDILDSVKETIKDAVVISIAILLIAVIGKLLGVDMTW